MVTIYCLLEFPTTMSLFLLRFRILKTFFVKYLFTLICQDPSHSQVPKFPLNIKKKKKMNSKKKKNSGNINKSHLYLMVFYIKRLN